MVKKRNIILVSILMILSFFVLPSFVFAQDDSSTMPILKSTTANNVFKPVWDLFSNWGAGQLDINVAKFLFWMLVFIIIFSVSDFIPFFTGKNGLKIMFALIVSFLGTAYFAPTDVYVLLASYTAMGMALGAVVPLLVLMAFTYQIARSRRIGAGSYVINVFMWLIYGGWLIMKIIQGARAGLISSGSWIVFFICIVFTVIMIFFQRHIMRWLGRMELDAVRNRLERRRDAEEIMGEHDEGRVERAAEPRRRRR